MSDTEVDVEIKRANLLKVTPEDVKSGKRKLRPGEGLSLYHKAMKTGDPDAVLAWREEWRRKCRMRQEKRKSGPAIDLLWPCWRPFIDILPACKWDNSLALTKVAGLPPIAYKNFAAYLKRRPTLQRAIREKREQCCPSAAGSVSPEELDESDRLRAKVMKDLEWMADHANSHAVQLKALEALAKTQGMFIDRQEHLIGPTDGGDADRARERARKFVESQQKKTDAIV